jgi:hypothetical protein
MNERTITGGMFSAEVPPALAITEAQKQQI